MVTETTIPKLSWSVTWEEKEGPWYCTRYVWKTEFDYTFEEAIKRANDLLSRGLVVKKIISHKIKEDEEDETPQPKKKPAANGVSSR